LKKHLVISMIVLGLGLTAEAADSSFQLIVNTSVTGTAVTREVVAGIFLKKVQRWGDGQSIDAIDLTATSDVREAFSESILGMPVAGVRIYWMDKVSKGLWPPRTKETDADVIAYVGSHAGGIGYVAAGTPIPSTVKILNVQ
jgi:ABC-type phosphate transport system substrate-binding protein